MNLATKKEVMELLYPYFAKDESMVLLVGDMGFAVLDKYFDNFPHRSFNVGIAEQAMVGIAAGMALCGLKPIIYAQIPFLVMRAYEQIRYDIAEHNLNVILVGVGADNYFSELGRSHCMDSDDIDMIKILPNVEIISCDKVGVGEVLKKRFESAACYVEPDCRYVESPLCHVEQSETSTYTAKNETKTNNMDTSLNTQYDGMDTSLSTQYDEKISMTEKDFVPAPPPYLQNTKSPIHQVHLGAVNAGICGAFTQKSRLAARFARFKQTCGAILATIRRICGAFASRQLSKACKIQAFYSICGAIFTQKGRICGATMRHFATLEVANG